jgi:hypothetical protein
MANSLKKLSQTCLKDYESDETCPRRWKGQWIDFTVPFGSNEHMDKGSYFENLCLGESATGEIVADLPRLKNGKKSIAHQRIDSQVDKFKYLFETKFKDEEIVNTQLEIHSLNKRDRGTIDFETVNKKTNIPTLWDLKLTADVTATRHWAHWGHPDDAINVTQAYFYTGLYEETTGYRPLFNYLVFDYSTKMNTKFLQVETFNEDLVALNVRKDNLLNWVDENNSFFWDEVPSEKECDRCPLKCFSRITKD